MRTILIAFFSFITYIVFAQKTIVEISEKYANTISPKGLKEKLTILSGAEMEGRETTTHGQKKAAAFIEGIYQKLELLPGTSGGFQMQFPIYQDTLLDASFTVRNMPFIFNQDWSVNISSSANGNYDVKDIVFVSYGQVDSTRNDYKDLNVKDKWVLLIEGSPGVVSYDRKNAFVTKSKIQTALDLGVKGIIVMSTDFPRKDNSETKGKMSLKKPNLNMGIPVLYVTSDLAHNILGMNPKQLLQSIKNIPTGTYDTKFSHVVSKRTLMLHSSNVIAIIPGTDKKDEYVVISSHYDHLGIRGKDIYYGADDDGSGTTGVMQLAEAFAKAKEEGHGPRRTIVFINFSGEEKGLLGSEFYTDHPSQNLTNVSADLNIDMIGRIDSKIKTDTLNYLYIIGDDKLSSALKKVTDSINTKYTKLTLDRRYNNLTDPNRYYYRSDHYNFAKKGVPVIFYFNGTHADYHKPTDTVDKINFELMAKRLKLIYYTAWELANRNEMLIRDIPLK